MQQYKITKWVDSRTWKPVFGIKKKRKQKNQGWANLKENNRTLFFTTCYDAKAYIMALKEC